MNSIKMLKIKSLTILISSIIFCLLLPACSKAQKKTSDAQKVQITKSDPWTEKRYYYAGNSEEGIKK